MKALIIAAAVATLLSGCYEKDRIAALEKENQKLKSELAAMRSVSPTGVDIKRLHEMGRERFSNSLPDIDNPPAGYKTAVSMLGGIAGIEQSPLTPGPLISKADIKQHIKDPLRVLQDMWPANTSPAGQEIDPRLEICKNLPGLYLTTLDVTQQKDDLTTAAASLLVSKAKDACILALAGISASHKRKPQ